MVAYARRITSRVTHLIRTQIWRWIRCRLDARHLKRATTGPRLRNSNHYRSETLQTLERCIGLGEHSWNYAIMKWLRKASRRLLLAIPRCTTPTFSRLRRMKRWGIRPGLPWRYRAMPRNDARIW